MRADSPLRKFDPHRLARYEKENYVAYYQKDWLKLLRVSVRMVGEAFGLSFFQAVYAAYLVARAEVAFAPFPNNNIPQAQAYMRRFYEFLKQVHREEFDVERAARLEVDWWIVHRRLFANPDNGDLVEALTALYAEAYGVAPNLVRPAAQQRALGMLYSDQWVNAGKDPKSPLLVKEEEALFQSYVLLKQAIGKSPNP
jgi:hypothetical protein